ncbi:MBL fold metallo-hydrolase [Bacillus wiedmannii]|uniref:MBL fold metallo-hydrolase n=1 Tax=Bacillus wiedmannii TaxID=1890302 RepID=A0A2B6UGG0_9BACI|nr:MBL fold metallo-hydrolase [Bacillus wiedmannii]PEM89605.1 MBL fold metallo-hydrolase [Bacillus wiedmannii]PEO88218.1 MBL fold metallo-hydrolase [Bacillus wiedmannii]PGD64423.1 MBL fold metallo-hydrolase [Bacillus wiedmannii]PHG59830.1 MBL fold metallo-hydrolase [Bacillus wiedmannii]
MIFTLKAIPAHNGDCFIISFGDSNNVKNILVDGGRTIPSYLILKRELEEISKKGQVIDLLILTHIDDDHIAGLIRLFKDSKIDKSIIKEVWFNSKEVLSSYFYGVQQEDTHLKVQVDSNSEISYKQGISLGTLLENYEISNKKVIKSGFKRCLGEAKIEVLSPNQEQLQRLLEDWERVFPNNKGGDTLVASTRKSNDYSSSIEELIKREFKEDKDIVNGSSIAFLLTFKGKNILMLGDSFPSIVAENIIKRLNESRLSIDLVKVSHHGSKHNTSTDLLELIKCENFLISTNGKSHGHPSKETLVKIANRFKQKDTKTRLYFNYRGVQDNVFNQEEKDILNIECVDSEYMNNNILVVDLWKGLER